MRAPTTAGLLKPLRVMHALEDHLLLQYLGFRGDDILLAALHFGFGLDDVDLGERTEFGAALVVVIELRY